MKVAVVGLGHVGLTAAVCLASRGHYVSGFEVDPEVRTLVANGQASFSEPYLAEMLCSHRDRLCVVESLEEAVALSESVLVCVGTPLLPDGDLDSTQLESVVRDIAESGHLPWVVVLSTALPEVHRRILASLPARLMARYVVHPEFLREGTAVRDYLDPPLTIFGSPAAVTGLRQLAQDLYGIDDPILCDAEEASLVKYAANAWHATKVNFAN